MRSAHRCLPFRDGNTLLLSSPLIGRPILIAPVGGDTLVDLEGGGEWIFERDGSERGAPVRRLATGPARNRRVFVKQSR